GDSATPGGGAGNPHGVGGGAGNPPGNDTGSAPGVSAPGGVVVEDDSDIIVPDTTVRPAGCGDGVLTEDEACDDGNVDDNDGCNGDCLTVNPGYSCAQPGQPCQPIARCGDGLVA